MGKEFSYFKELLTVLGFLPKNGAIGIFKKTYSRFNYTVEVDFANQKINYGNKIRFDSKTTQNFSQPENFVVLECVDRLLEKGYKPQNIYLEKTWPSGHRTSGRLDICVLKNDGSEYLLIECKTFGKEFDKELKAIKTNGGQLFTYFKFSNKADILMLYSSKHENDKVIFENQIIKIEDEYRLGDVADFYDKWNKLTKDNGIFESGRQPYCFESKALVKSQLKPITQNDSSFIFNQFAEILRHNVVSDKGNAFNKIFTLFLCKVYDETQTKKDGRLDFQWLEGTDDHSSFQLRLTKLYKNGMKRFLSRNVSDFDETEFDNKYKNLSAEVKQQLLEEINILRLEKNNEFAIKEVYDHDSFLENAKIVKEIVELLQGYQIRYTERQQYLSDFFELLLTTGLKQEAGQFFTPVPVAQYIIKSLPLEQIVEKRLDSKGGRVLPYMIDYAAGSGHFITEYMFDVQNIINKQKPSKYIEDTAKKIRTWKEDQYDWASEYIYGIEKDYRLVKVGKVGCYLHGDGLANVILSDGLGSFSSTKDYKGKLKNTNKESRDNQKFDVVLSNPPYSISSFRQTTRDYYTDKDFDLYKYLTDNSSEIECLFVERTKQLLKDGGVAGIILPSSILTNTGIYTKTREIMFKYFEIIGITELGSNTFMATGTKTVVLFLKRKNNYDWLNIEKSVNKFFETFNEVTINSIEHPVSKYLDYVYEDITLKDYLTLLKKTPNFKIKEHDIYKEYKQKFNKKNSFYKDVFMTEKEKLFYFLLAYNQKTVIVKTGEKKAEKQFLGYEFSHRRGNEGIHPIDKSKSIEECTQLFDSNRYDNPKRASTYMYKAFQGNYGFDIDNSLKKNVFVANLIDLMTFNRADFDKNINTNFKKKIKIDSNWEQKRLLNIVSTIESGSRPNGGVQNNNDGILSLGGEHIHNTKGILDLSIKKFVPIQFFKNAKTGIAKQNDILLCKDGALTGKIASIKDELINQHAIVNEHVYILRCDNAFTQKYVFNVLFSSKGQELLKSRITGAAQGGLNYANLSSIKIPFPALSVQQKIVEEIENIDKENEYYVEQISKTKTEISNLLSSFPKGNVKQLCYVVNEKCTPKVGVKYNYVGLENIESQTGKVTEINMDGANLLSAKNIYKKNCVLYGKLRPYLNKVAISENQGVCSTDIIVLKTQYPIVLKYLLLSNDTVEQAKMKMKGVNHPRISVSDFLNLQIPLPSYADLGRVSKRLMQLEKDIIKNQEIISKSKEKKEAVLDKYL